LPLKWEQYLELLDWTGRQTRLDKRGQIPAELLPILEQLRLSSETWVETVLNFGRWFRLAAGSVGSLAAEAARRGRRWLQGVSHRRAAFAQPGFWKSAARTSVADRIGSRSAPRTRTGQIGPARALPILCVTVCPSARSTARTNALWPPEIAAFRNELAPDQSCKTPENAAILVLTVVYFSKENCQIVLFGTGAAKNPLQAVSHEAIH